MIDAAHLNGILQDAGLPTDKFYSTALYYSERTTLWLQCAVWDTYLENVKSLRRWIRLRKLHNALHEPHDNVMFAKVLGSMLHRDDMVSADVRGPDGDYLAVAFGFMLYMNNVGSPTACGVLPIKKRNGNWEVKYWDHKSNGLLKLDSSEIKSASLIYI